MTLSLAKRLTNLQTIGFGLPLLFLLGTRWSFINQRAMRVMRAKERAMRAMRADSQNVKNIYLLQLYSHENNNKINGTR